MNARKLRTPEPVDKPSMKGPFFKSSLFHIIIFVGTLIGIPFVAKEPLLVNPVSVELVNIADVTTTDRMAPKQNKKPENIEPPKPPEEKKPPPKQEMEKPPEIKEPEPPKPDPPKPEEKKPAEPEKVPEPPKKEEKPKPKPPEPKPEKKEEQDFESLLRDLTPDEEEAPEQTDDQSETTEAMTGNLAELSTQLSVSELDAFKHQLEPCWVIPAGAKYAEDLAVEIRVEMRRDMTVKDASVLDQGRYNRDNTFRAAADSALRALRNPRCSPLKLPPEKYNQWKVIIINFDPRNML